MTPPPPAHGGDRVAAALQAHGVPVVFTLCGGHISPILVAAKARGMRVVDTRDEATAVFAADAMARLTGMEIQDNLDQNVVIKFTDLDSESALSAADFVFSPPPGADLFYYDE